MTYLDLDWRVIIFYNTVPAGLTQLTHQMKFFVNLTDGTTPGGLWDDLFAVTRRNGTEQPLAEYVNDFLALVAEVFHTSTAFSRGELWAAPAGSNDFVFYSAGDLIQDGISGTPPGAYHQATLTMRAASGKTGRVQMMEDISTDLSRFLIGSSGGLYQDIVGFVSGALSAHLHRDRSFFISPINYCGTFSDALEKKRNR
jgi:hypothetical protein